MPRWVIIARGWLPQLNGRRFMKKEVFEYLKEKYNRIPNAFGGPVHPSEIEKAEKTLGVQLPDDYKEYLLHFGSGGLPAYSILGLNEHTLNLVGDLVNVTLEFRQNWLPEEYKDMVVICEDHAGNPIGFLPDNPTIFVLDHDFGGKFDLAPTFEGFLEKLINRETL